MRISDWSSDVCSSDLLEDRGQRIAHLPLDHEDDRIVPEIGVGAIEQEQVGKACDGGAAIRDRAVPPRPIERAVRRSEERRVGKECGSPGRYRWVPYH